MGGNISVTIFASKDIVKEKNIDCGKILMAACESVGRKGGGRPDFAQTGWKDSDGIDHGKFLARVKAKFKEVL